MAEREREKPITIKGERTILSIFIGENKITLTVSRRTETGFERVDRFIIPVDYLLFKIFEKNRSSFSGICEIFERLEETERPEELPNVRD
jgi:methyl coenzyme M reductase subunit D